MKLPRMIQCHWTTEYLRYRIRHSNTFVVPQIGLEIEIGPKDVAVDCGANIGNITSRLARTGATVFAFEPNPYCFSILKKRFRAISRVHCFNAGVMDERCTRKLRVPDPHAQFDAITVSVAGTFEPTALNANAYTISEIEAECIDLSDFILTLNRQIRFLKLDIEGAEIAVLHKLIDTGAVDLIDLIAAETHEKQMPTLARATSDLETRIKCSGLDSKIRLDWP